MPETRTPPASGGRHLSGRVGTRRRAELTLRELAAELGVCHTSISHWERGFIEPRGPARVLYAATLARLANQAVRTRRGLTSARLLAACLADTEAGGSGLPHFAACLIAPFLVLRADGLRQLEQGRQQRLGFSRVDHSPQSPRSLCLPGLAHEQPRPPQPVQLAVRRGLRSVVKPAQQLGFRRGRNEQLDQHRDPDRIESAKHLCRPVIHVLCRFCIVVPGGANVALHGPIGDMTQPTFLDLFSGAGGLSLGLAAAGWQPLLAVENWRDAATTYGENFRDHKLVDGDVRDLSPARLAALLPDRPEWVVGGPPCQGFSTVGKRVRRDPRNLLVIEFHRIVKTLRPDGFVIENVLGLKDMRFEAGVIDLFADLGYDVSFHVVRAADFGVPQLRRRVVFVGHFERGHFGVPVPTHAPTDYVTVWDAIGDLPVVGPGETAVDYATPPKTEYQRFARIGSSRLQGHTVSNHPPHLVHAISFIPDGGNRRSIPDEFQPRSGFHNSYSRLSSQHPAVAVTSNMGKPSATRCVHPFQHRGLTAREGARLQSFPDRFHFRAGVTSQRLQIANAVPPLLAQRLGERLTDVANWGPHVAAQLELRVA